MTEKERVARTVAIQRTGDASRWVEFQNEVEAAFAAIERDPATTVRDYLGHGDEAAG